MGLVAQEQVLKHEVMALVDEGGQGGEEAAESSSIPGGSAIVPDGVLPSHSLPVEPLLTGSYPIDKALAAFEAASDRSAASKVQLLFR